MATNSDRVDDISIKQLQSLLGNISEEDCVVLIEEFGTNETDLTEVAQSVFEALDESKLHSVADLVWHIKKNPCFGGGRRSRCMQDGNSTSGPEPWILARSRSSNNIQKSMNGTMQLAAQPRSASAAPRAEIYEQPGQIHIPPPVSVTPTPFYGPRIPIRIRRIPNNMDPEQLRAYLTKCMLDPAMNDLLHEIYDNKTINLLIIMRGASGSGKSTLASLIWAITEHGVICSADQYFMKNGTYKFNKNALGEAHDECKKKCRSYLDRGENPVIVDNTNTRVDELMPYAQLAVEFNYAVKLLEPCTEWRKKPGMLTQKNTHNVPRRTIEMQLERFEEISERVLIDKVLSRMEGKYKYTYNPPILNWGLAAAAAAQAQQAQAIRAQPSSTTPPAQVSAAAASYFPIGLWTPVVTSTLNSIPSTAPPVNASNTIQFPLQNSKISMPNQHQRQKLPSSLASGFSSPPPLQTASSWTDPMAVRPTSPLLLSALIPDFSLTNIPPKPKRAGKKSGNGSGSSQLAGATALPTKPFEFEDPAHAAFKKLQKLFPNVTDKDKLEELFNTCEGDLDACAVVLLEEGYMLADIVDEPDTYIPSEVTDKKNVEDKFEDLLNLDSIDDNELAGATALGYRSSGLLQGGRIPYAVSNVVGASGTSFPFTPEEINNPPYHRDQSSNSPPITNSQFSGATIGKNTGVNLTSDTFGGALTESLPEEEYNFDMTLPMDFARILLAAFGHPEDETRSLSTDELSIKVSADTAFELYKSLYINMHKAESESARNDSDESTRSNSPNTVDDEYNAIAISLCQMELETQSNDPQLASIMDIESKIHQHTQESLKPYMASNRTMAQNIKFCQLKQDYPFLDDAVINEVYTQCFLDDTKTRAALREMYPSASVISGSRQSAPEQTTWSLKYNPKDTKLYSTDELKYMQKTYDDLEKQWLAQYGKIKDYHQKIKNTSSPQIKAHYFAEAKLLTDSMKSISDEMQYYKAISLNAKHKNDQILDLHGLKIDGAMRVLKEFLEYKQQEFMQAGTPKMILLIITGKGKHSRNGSPVIQPAVRNFLTQRQYKFHSSKPGSYTVILTRGNIVQKKK